MKKNIRKVMFVVVGAAIIISGILIMRAADNRGDEPFVYLKMDEGYASTTYDATGNANNATLVGNASWADESECLSGRCIELDGTGDYLSIPDFALE